MIPLSALRNIFTALPNSYLSDPVHVNSETENENPIRISWILDSKREKIGSLDWKYGIITIFKQYEYSDEVIESLGADRFTEVIEHFNYEDEKHKINERADQNKQELEEFMNQNDTATKALYE